jgi:hypothetical protein
MLNETFDGSREIGDCRVGGGFDTQPLCDPQTKLMHFSFECLAVIQSSWSSLCEGLHIMMDVGNADCKLVALLTKT